MINFDVRVFSKEQAELNRQFVDEMNRVLGTNIAYNYSINKSIAIWIDKLKELETR